MTERLYYNDSTLASCMATVRDIISQDNSYRVILDRTVFYPTSGGQFFDTGYLNTIPVIDVIDTEGEIEHVLKDRPDFVVGEIITAKIDVARRRDNMQKHTGQHILSQAFIAVCETATVSAHLGEDDNTIDVNTPDLPEDDIIRAELLANEIIFENRPVAIEYHPFEKLSELPLRKIPDRAEGDYRIIIIKDFDWSACGGTHCAATGGVGIIKITGRERVRENTRLHFLTGIQALEDYHWRLAQIEEISNLFTRHGRESAEAVKSMYDENTALRRKLAKTRKNMLPTLIRQWYQDAVVHDSCKIIARDFSGDDFKDVRETALAIINSREVVALCGCDDKLIIAIAKGIPYSAGDLLKKFISANGGKGGGSPQLAQGGGFDGKAIKVLLADPGRIFDL